jgi:DNA-binding LacI/PurR family transcriptional regulator
MTSSRNRSITAFHGRRDFATVTASRKEQNGPFKGSLTGVAVAKAANVSQSTVSLVLSGKAAGRVSAATHALVEETARRLGYQPNVSAQMLRTGMAKVLALAVPNVKQPYFGQIFVAAEEAAREFEYSVILIDTSTDPAWAARLVSMLRSRLVAGCVVYASDSASEDTLRPVRRQILFIEGENPRTSGIDLDLRAGMRAVANHFATLGHKRIGYFAAEYPKATFKRRFRALLAEFDRLGLRHEPEWQASASFELDPATETARRLLEKCQFTALFCDDDLLAAAVYRAASQLGVSIPDQLSVVGFNDLELARMLHPELTSVAIPANSIGAIAVDRLLRQVKQKRPAPPYVADLELQLRASTAAPPRDTDTRASDSQIESKGIPVRGRS